MMTARDLIRQDIEIDHQIRAINYYMGHQEFCKECGIPYATHLWYVAYNKACDEYRDKVEPQIEALQASRFDVFIAIRTLPEDEARYLYKAVLYHTDGDRGYGSWPDLDKEPKDWY